MLSYLYTIGMFLLKTILLPVYIVYYLLWYIYRTIFFIQFSMSYTCESFFGNGYGCDILNPDYVFTTMIYQSLKMIIIVYICLKLYELYIKYKE